MFQTSSRFFISIINKDPNFHLPAIIPLNSSDTFPEFTPTFNEWCNEKAKNPTQEMREQQLREIVEKRSKIVQ
jgi:hypothetical protein